MEDNNRCVYCGRWTNYSEACTNCSKNPLDALPSFNEKAQENDEPIDPREDSTLDALFERVKDED